MTPYEQLVEERARINETISELNQQLAEINSRKLNLKAELQHIEKEISVLGTEVSVTDHAILRYLERVEGVDIDRIKKLLLPETLKNQVKILGGGEYTLDGFRVRVKKNTVVTVLPSDMK